MNNEERGVKSGLEVSHSRDHPGSAVPRVLWAQAIYEVTDIRLWHPHSFFKNMTQFKVAHTNRSGNLRGKKPPSNCRCRSRGPEDGLLSSLNCALYILRGNQWRCLIFSPDMVVYWPWHELWKGPLSAEPNLLFTSHLQRELLKKWICFMENTDFFLNKQTKKKKQFLKYNS